jgi:hypothetical protein
MPKSFKNQQERKEYFAPPAPPPFRPINYKAGERVHRGPHFTLLREEWPRAGGHLLVMQCLHCGRLIYCSGDNTAVATHVIQDHL